MARVLRLIAEDTAGGTVFHCMAGKDRTGVFSAVVLGLLGVADVDIVADYVLTHDVVDVIIERGRRDWDERDTSRWKDLPADMLGAVAPSMAGMIEGMRETYGDWPGYAEAIGVEPDVVDALQAQLLDS